jgi:hypothetical protein
MDISATGGQLWELTAGNNQNPALTQGNVTKWDLNDVPDRSPTGPLAYYLPCLLLTIFATITQPAEGGSLINFRDLRRAFIDSIDWVNAWHGTPVSKNHVTGVELPLIEWISGGFRYAQRQPNAIPTTSGDYAVQLTVAIPACARQGKLLKDTSQLALLFQPSSLKLNVAPASVLDSLSTGAVVKANTMSASLSAVLVPRQEIVLGTGIEWILHQVVAGVNSPAVKVVGFGRDTNFTGVEPKGGVLWLGELTDVAGQPGVFTAENVEEFSFAWRGQQQLRHVLAWQAMIQQAQPVHRVIDENGLAAGVTPGVNDLNDYPYSGGVTSAPGGYSANQILVQALAWVMVQGGDDLRLTDVQTADRDETYFLTVSGGFATGDHQILAQYARVWQEAKRASFVSEVMKGGANSLAAYVLGGPANAAAAAARGLRPRFPRDKHVLTADQTAYLPFQLV